VGTSLPQASLNREISQQGFRLPESPKSFHISEPPDLIYLWKQLIKGETSTEHIFSCLTNVSAPYGLEIDMTGGCNLTCPYCIYGENFRKDSPALSLPRIFELIDESLAAGVKVITLTGKEPFLSPKTLDVLQHLSVRKTAYEFRFGCITNGTVANRYLDRLKECAPDFLDVSLDGSLSMNDQIRGEGSFSQAVSFLKQCAATLGTELSISSVLQPGVPDGLWELYEDMAPLIKNYNVSPLIPTPRFQNVLSRADCVRFAEKMLSFLEASPHALNIHFNVYSYYIKDLLEGGLVDFRKLKQHPAGYLSVTETIGRSRLAWLIYPFPLEFWRYVRISYDGYYLGGCAFVMDADYRRFAVGNIQGSSFQTLFQQSLQPGSFLHELVRGWENHECASKKCFPFCLGFNNGFNVLTAGNFGKKYPQCGE
jgi:MoaA/NifB/PqqE/SkfB family radical SAM enzyme